MTDKPDSEWLLVKWAGKPVGPGQFVYADQVDRVIGHVRLPHGVVPGRMLVWRLRLRELWRKIREGKP